MHSIECEQLLEQEGLHNGAPICIEPHRLLVDSTIPLLSTMGIDRTVWMAMQTLLSGRCRGSCSRSRRMCCAWTCRISTLSALRYGASSGILLA